MHSASDFNASGITRMRWRVIWDYGENWRDEFSIGESPATVTAISTLSRRVYLPAQRKLFVSDPALVHDAEGGSGRSGYTVVEPPTIAGRRDLIPIFGTKLSGDSWQIIEDERGPSGTSRARLRLTSPAGSRSPELGYWLGVDEYEIVTDPSIPFLREIKGYVDGQTAAYWRLGAFNANQEIPEGALELQLPGDVSVERFTDIVDSPSSGTVES